MQVNPAGNDVGDDPQQKKIPVKAAGIHKCFLMRRGHRSLVMINNGLLMKVLYFGRKRSLL